MSSYKKCWESLGCTNGARRTTQCPRSIVMSRRCLSDRFTFKILIDRYVSLWKRVDKVINYNFIRTTITSDYEKPPGWRPQLTEHRHWDFRDMSYSLFVFSTRYRYSPAVVGFFFMITELWNYEFVWNSKQPNLWWCWNDNLSRKNLLKI